MIAIDANLLIYAHSSSSPDHAASLAWFESCLDSDEPVGIPNLCVHAFLRFVTNPKIADRPLSFEDGVEVVDRWLLSPHLSILYPGNNHWSIVTRLAQRSRLRGAILTDAFIAATAIEYGATLFTHDRDFARFAGLRWHDPLED
jgi:uncharacterized protein